MYSTATSNQLYTNTSSQRQSRASIIWVLWKIEGGAAYPCSQRTMQLKQGHNRCPIYGKLCMSCTCSALPTTMQKRQQQLTASINQEQTIQLPPWLLRQDVLKPVTQHQTSCRLLVQCHRSFKGFTCPLQVCIHRKKTCTSEQPSLSKRTSRILMYYSKQAYILPDSSN